MKEETYFCDRCGTECEIGVPPHTNPDIEWKDLPEIIIARTSAIDPTEPTRTSDICQNCWGEFTEWMGL